MNVPVFGDIIFQPGLTCVSLTSHRSKSGMPSPVMAEVGTMDTVRVGSSLFQYSSVLRPFSITSARREQ